MQLSISSNNISDEIMSKIGERVELVKKQVDDFTKGGFDAISKNEKVGWGRAKMMIMGKGAAGKSSTIRTLLKQPVVLEHDSMVGVDLNLIRSRDWVQQQRADDADLDEMLSKSQYRPKSIPRRVSQRVSESLARLSGSKKKKDAPKLQIDEKEVAKV